MSDPSHRQMVEDIRSAEGAMGGITLSQWEAEFVESIEEQLGNKRSLTENQAEKLEQIWNRV